MVAYGKCKCGMTPSPGGLTAGWKHKLGFDTSQSSRSFGMMQGAMLIIAQRLVVIHPNFVGGARSRLHSMERSGLPGWCGTLQCLPNLSVVNILSSIRSSQSHVIPEYVAFIIVK